jgi:hypothetical protein
VGLNYSKVMITNFFKIALPFDEFNVQRLLYSESKLKTLRADHNSVASFFRRDDFIYISPKKGVALDLGELVIIKVHEQPDVVESLIRHLIFRAFRDAFPDRIPDSFYPLRFPSIRPEHDPIRRHIPAELHSVIGFPRVNEVHVRRIVREDSIQFGLIIFSRHQWRLTRNLFLLAADGFPLGGCTVLHSLPIPGLSGILAPDESVVGVVEKIEGDVACVQTNEGNQRIPLNELYLQRSREQLGNYLAFKLGNANATRVFRNLREGESERVKQGRYFGEIVKVAGWFSQQEYANNDGFTFRVTTDSKFLDGGFRLEPTRLVFDYGPGASAKRPLAGLLNYGPFDSSRFEPKSPRFLAIFLERNRGAVTQYLAQLRDGIPNSQYFQKGFRDLFRLHEIDYTLKAITSSSPEQYERAIDEPVTDSGGKRFSLALVEFAEDSDSFPDAQNPYLRAKARLMSYGIPVQGIRESHLRASSETLGYTLGPIALQMYAKVGGIPWLLPGSQSVDAELIVGIGNAIYRRNLWSGADQSRVVGLTTFFLGDGRYLMGHELRSVPYSEYFDELLRSLEDSIRQVSTEYAWKQGKTVRIVFHVFKPLKNLEVEVVDELIRRFSQFKILYAFITVSTKHPWMMFQDAQKQGEGWKVSLCDRGANLVLDESSCLLQLKGESDRPNKKHRPPLPVLIRLHDKSTYRDLQFISQQIMDFSYLSWRSFFPNETPVTIFYSALMASLSGRLQHITGWNPVFLDQHFRRKTWFL